MFRTLRGRITATYFLVVIMSLVLVSLVSLFFLARYIRDRDRRDLAGQVGAVAEDIRQVNLRIGAQAGQAGPENAGQKLVAGLLTAEARVLKCKLVLLSTTGRVVAESPGRPVFGNRVLELPPDVLGARKPVVIQRYFPRLGKDYLFAAAPTGLREGAGHLVAVKPVERIASFAGPLVLYVVVAGLVALALSMLLALYLSSAISRPVREVTEAARRMAAGDYGQSVAVRGHDETAELAADFNLMSERVRAAYELQRDFVGNVSHELRTPLTSIEGFSQALLEGMIDTPEGERRSLAIINQESKRMERLLNDLMLLSRIDSGAETPTRQAVDVTGIVNGLAETYSERARDAGISLECRAPGAPVFVNTDPDRLTRVLTNLLDNALKYTGAGGTVSLSAAAGDGRVSFSVSDTGPGIPPEHLPHIFERFHRVEPSRAQKHGGSGLGLSICRELVGTLGGTIDVQSSVGRGTSFTVTLPLG